VCSSSSSSSWGVCLGGRCWALMVDGLPPGVDGVSASCFRAGYDRLLVGFPVSGVFRWLPASQRLSRLVFQASGKTLELD
jgi:hypothetical protein